MLKQLTHFTLWVNDQDEALAFYTDKLGLEVRDDVTVPEMGNFRWLTVGPVGQPDISVALVTVPGPPVFDAETAAQVEAVLAKGVTGSIMFSTDDCRATFEELSGSGVEFSQEPEQRPYGIDAEIRDPSGNRIRVVQSS